ncbi:MAG: hypothetical protein WCD04_17395 [Terriglobia bacterium]|jgi:hypothetical protein
MSRLGCPFPYQRDIFVTVACLFVIHFDGDLHQPLHLEKAGVRLAYLLDANLMPKRAGQPPRRENRQFQLHPSTFR